MTPSEASDLLPWLRFWRIVAGAGRFRNVNIAYVASQILPTMHGHWKTNCNLKQIEIDRLSNWLQCLINQDSQCYRRSGLLLVMSTSSFSRHEEYCRFLLNRSMSDGQHRDSRVQDGAVDSRGNHLGNDYSKLLCWTSFYLNLGREVRYPFVFISVLLSN